MKRYYRRGENTIWIFFDKHYKTANESLEKLANDSLIGLQGEQQCHSSFEYAIFTSLVAHRKQKWMFQNQGLYNI